MHELSPDLVSQRLGVVSLEPTGPVIAGSLGQWRLVYTVGSYGMDEGGTIKLAAIPQLCCEILRITGVDQRFETFLDIKSAVGSYVQ